MEMKNVLETEEFMQEEPEQIERDEDIEFRELGICENLLKAIEEERFERPTEIQRRSILSVVQGKDVIVRASTGSGKTLVFSSVILKNVKKDFGIQSLILAPTRELVNQITKAINKFSKYKPLSIISVYGGVSINPQIDNLEDADVVVGTPGRILDHISRGTIDLSNLKILVLDEADRMLDMGFIKDVEKIIYSCPKKRQTLLFSATISEEISRLARNYMINPIEIFAEQYVDPKKLTQVYYDVSDDLKYSFLRHLLENEKSKLVMIFCNTRKNVDFVANNLRLSRINALPIHGGFSQDKRNKIMERFNSEKFQILICTDVAARGLDIPGVSHVYNYDIPADSKEYLHRIGRTARAGKEGKVINIIASRDYENFRSVLKNEDIVIKKEPTPEVSRAMIKWMPERRTMRGFRGGGGFERDRRFGNNRGVRRFGRDRGERESGNNRENRRFGNNRNPGRNERNSNYKNRFSKRVRRW